MKMNEINTVQNAIAKHFDSLAWQIGLVLAYTACLPCRAVSLHPTCIPQTGQVRNLLSSLINVTYLIYP